jgi:hypothetical protein
MANARLLLVALTLTACAVAPAGAAVPLHDVCLGPSVPLVSPQPALGEPSAFLSLEARLSGTQTPELYLAQRAIDRELDHPKPAAEPTEYQVVDVEGWKSPALAGGMSALVPGTGQLYTGQKRGYIYLGLEALALYTYFHFDSQAGDLQSEAFSYAGDPNVSTSRWSFDRYEQTASSQDVQEIRQIYERDQVEFYSRISSEAKYFVGWTGTSEDEKVDSVAGYRVIDEDRADAQRTSNLGLFTAIANSVVSAVDAFRQARLNNIELLEDWNLRLKAKTGRDTGLTALVTHRFH